MGVIRVDDPTVLRDRLRWSTVPCEDGNVLVSSTATGTGTLRASTCEDQEKRSDAVLLAGYGRPRRLAEVVRTGVLDVTDR